MPELPEAETIVRTLAPHLEGRRILELRFFSDCVRRGDPQGANGQRILKVTRYGKMVVLMLTEGMLLIRLGMTGRLLLNSVPGQHTRAMLYLDEGSLRFDDARKFGSIEWVQQLPDYLGADPLAITFKDFAARLRLRRGAVKPLLLNQKFLRGIGNIYADESLFRAGVHPRAKASSLNQARVRRLFEAIRQVLSEAIAAGGSTISDYVDAMERAGSFQYKHLVYRRTGAPCVHCGSPIRRIVVAQRGTHYCPRCQKL